MHITAAVIVVLQVLDELLPKATGREARIEKKRARAEERRAREISPGKVHPLFNNLVQELFTNLRSAKILVRFVSWHSY